MPRSLADLVDRTDIERGAKSIGDPVERLRYVRQATATADAPKRVNRRLIVWLGLAAAVVSLRSDGRYRRPAAMQRRPGPDYRAPSALPNVWPVEQTAEYDLFSNGLRIENRLSVANEPRSYRLISADSELLGPLRTQPAGIVFHTTESDQAPFDSGQKPALKRIGREVLLFVRNKRAYHFLIDRFGQVHRIVVETDSANHAGHSIWADSRWVYLDLNASFLGVAFEASMQGGESPVTSAQTRAGRALTEALRSKYNLAAENCVTHAQVSVNPSNMRIGWHTDWVSRFPYEQFGLPDNYAITSPSLCRFGFQYDPDYLNSSGAEMRRSLTAADARVRSAAEERGVTISEYRRLLRERYARAQASLRARSTAQENENEQNRSN